MGYNYQTERDKLFTDKGQKHFLSVRDKVKKLLETAGAFRSHEATTGSGCGDSWEQIACIDRLVELGEIKELSQPGTFRSVSSLRLDSSRMNQFPQRLGFKSANSTRLAFTQR